MSILPGFDMSNALYTTQTWLILLIAIGCTQYLAARQWEHRLWQQTPSSFGAYLRVGVLWGGLGVAAFTTTIFMVADPTLVVWLNAHGLILAYWIGCILCATWVAYSAVERPACPLTSTINVAVVSLLLTLSYPLLKFLQTGTFLIFPEHVGFFGIHLLLFSAILRLGNLTLGYPNLSIRANDARQWVRTLTDTRWVFAAACIALDAVLIIIQIDLLRRYPESMRGQPGSDSLLGFDFSETAPFATAWLAVGAIIFSLMVNRFNREQLARIQDRMTWSPLDTRLPAIQGLMLRNTELVKKALGLSNVAVVFWHAPRSEQGIGCDDLRQGTTFVSPGPLHAAGLAALKGSVNLPDFWDAILHPDDKGHARGEITAMLEGKTHHFSGTSRFKIEGGGWFTVRGELVVERSARNGLPLAIYGIHTDITQETHENESLGATRVRQLNALRMIGHDLRASLGATLMATSLIERVASDTLPPVVTRNLDRIKLSTERALDFLGNAITYARTEDHTAVGEPEDLVLDTFLQEVIARQCDRYRVAADKVILDCPPGVTLQGVLVFPLTAVLDNLVSNAIKYTPEPVGKVSVCVKSLGPRLQGIRGCTLIEVADEGVGIPATFIDRLYESFKRASNVGNIEGYGLGMSIVGNSVELLHAQLNVESAPARSKGTLFTLILPNALIPSRTPGTADPAVVAPDLQSRTQISATPNAGGAASA